MTFYRVSVTLLLLLASSVLHADIMLLVHGYQANANDWRSAGIVQRLAAFKWHDAGVVFVDANNQVAFSNAPLEAEKKIYTAHLPSEYPLLLQASTLESYVLEIAEANPDQAIVVVGHSAGGVVARGMLVRATHKLPVTQLITIASPHLGTGAAELGVMAANSPLSFVAPMMGANTINRSEQLYLDLLPETPGSLLFMLNRQAHPRIEYISLVRSHAGGLPTDLIVPKVSQRMENVYALRGLARSIVAGQGHGLHIGDADVIARLIEGQRAL